MASSLTTSDKASDSGFWRINDEYLRIVMVGKTGAGKSATGNTILGRKFFESKLSATPLTVDCSKGRAVVDGQKVAVIDTPGLFDTRVDKDETAQHLSQCISFASPGPHVFLVIISLGRYTEEEKQTVQNIQEFFGEAADKYSMVLFTHGDQLEDTTIEEFLDGCPDLQELVARCNGQYHVFNNKELKDRSQVIELLQKIREICKKNTGRYYTNEMFQQAERAVEEKKQCILRENEEQRRREIEELEGGAELNKEMKKIFEDSQHEKGRQLRIKRDMERRMEILELRGDIWRERDDREEDVREKKQRLQERHEKKARMKAEESNPHITLTRVGNLFKEFF